MANPSGIHNQEAGHGASSSLNGGPIHPTNGNMAAGSSGAGLKHNPGISMEWSAEEQAILEDGLNNYATDSIIIRYAKIAMRLPNKTVRDVAMRRRWMTRKEFSKRRKEDNLARKSKDKKERITDNSAKTSHFIANPNVPPSGILTPKDGDEMSYKAIGGVAGEVLEQNAEAFDKITANFSTLKLKENITLLAQARDNLFKMMSGMNEVPLPDLMRQMPQLPVKINEELANAILPPSKCSRN